jgi:hypothetical protein
LLERKIESYRQTSGMISATVVNANPFRRENARHLTPFDFFPGPVKRTPQQSVEEQIAILTKVMGVGPGKPGRA